MNAAEGLRRIAQVCRWIGLVSAVICGIWAEIEFLNHSNYIEFAVIFTIGLVGCAIFYVFGWVIAGFAKE